MGIQKTTANLKTRKRNGFSIVEILVMTTIISIVTAFGLVGITRARASVRLSGAAREYASYVEKARMHSIRSHADDETERAGVAINDGKASYDVTVDLDGDGTMDTRTITLPDDVSFETVETISFDWRGRTWSTVGGVTTANAQVSIRLQNSSESVSVDVTGSGDITIDSRVFDDAVPNVTLKVGDLASGATPEPTPVAIATPTPDAAPTPDLGDVVPVPSPEVNLGDGLPLPTPSPTATPTPNATPTPAATPTATPTPTPTPQTCTISTDPATLILSVDGTTTIKVSHNGNSSISITGASSKPSDLQVTPGGAQTVGAGSATSFTIKSKRSIGVYNITFSSGCGSKIVPVVVIL
jgi:type II secretory pathway pseudopilin PulG